MFRRLLSRLFLLCLLGGWFSSASAVGDDPNRKYRLSSSWPLSQSEFDIESTWAGTAWQSCKIWEPYAKAKLAKPRAVGDQTLTQDIWCDHIEEGYVWYMVFTLTCIDRWGNDCRAKPNNPIPGYMGYYSEKVIDRYFHRHKCPPCNGNPIYPLTGIKSQEVALDGIFGAEFGLTFENRDIIPFEEGAEKDEGVAQFLPKEFGKLWKSGSHKRLQLQKSDSNIVVAMLADRGGNDWQTFWKSGNYVPADPQNNNKIVVASGYRFIDVQNSAQEKYTYEGRLLERWSATGGKRLYAYSTEVIPGVASAVGQLLNVTDQFGRNVGYKYEGGHVYRIVRPDGAEIQLSYAGEDLLTLVWPDLLSKRFLYEHPKGLLTGILDEENNRYATFGYDGDGLARSTQHGSGAENFMATWSYAPRRYVHSHRNVQSGLWFRDHTWTLASDTSVTEPLGNTVSIGAKLVSGMPRQTSRSQTGGSGHDAAEMWMDYDTRGNVVSEIDYGGNRTCRAFESARNFESVRVDGIRIEDLPKEQACPDLVSYQVPADKPQRKITTTWHPLWKLETRRAEPKRITTTVYNDQIDPIKKDRAACATNAPLLPDGSKIAVVCRRYEQSTDDETGNLAFTATVKETRLWSYTYNEHGQLLTEKDPRGQVSGKTTSYEYWSGTLFNGAESHWQGDLKTVTNLLGQKTHYLEYNKLGQVLKIQHANGSIEQREYHIRGWLTKVTVTPAGGGVPLVTQYEYYGTGLLKKATQPDGSFSEYTWDGAHRLTDVADSLGNTVHYTLDNADNRTAEEVRDPLGTLATSISRTFDALGRVSSIAGAQ